MDSPVCVECTQKKRETNRHADNMHVLGDYCYISKGMVLNSYEDSDDEEFKKVDLISDTKDKIHCRKFLEGKGCEKYTPTEFVILNMEPYKGRDCYYRRQISSNKQTNALE